MNSSLTTSTAEAVFVFTGPIFDSQEIDVIGPGRVAVPTHFFKVILVLRPHDRTLHASILPNLDPIPQPLDAFFVSADEVERRTGLGFFSSLDDSAMLQR
ncbi:MAG: DNA/RNA non-specific endonuclease [Acidimicrobiia bacterium]|nr:DNA/RNA non-specific endonuclease [Acidimicrobiia bacterium]